MNARTRNMTLIAAFALTAGIGTAFAMIETETEVSEVPPPASTEMAVLMMRCGLDAESLAAAGVHSESTTGLIGKALAQHDAKPTAVSDADAGYADCKPVCDSLERKIRSGLGSDEDVAAYQAAVPQLEAFKASRQQALDDLFEAGIADLSAEQQATLRNIRSNRSWRLPVPYLVKERSEAQWVELRDALDGRRIDADLGEKTDPEVLAFLASVEGDAAVAAADSSLKAYLPSVQAAWNGAVSD